MQAILFGNYFYGFCAVFLSIETAFHLGIFSYLPFLYYLLIFLVTVVYYTKAYLQTQNNAVDNQRIAWYQQNKKYIQFTQKMYVFISIIFMGFIGFKTHNQWTQIPFLLLSFVIMTAITAFFYYGIERSSTVHNIRTIGFIKPFIIGFVWSSIVTIFPILIAILHGYSSSTIHLSTYFLFIQNGMFISVLCIMFDIKDYAADYNMQLKTFVVRIGLRKTIFTIIIPLIVVGFLANSIFSFTQSFSISITVINCIPFILLTIVALSLQQRKSILYYLAIIDGLMLVKALLGIFAFTCIN